MSRATGKHADYIFLTYIAIFIVFGMVILTSASSVVGLQRFGDSYFFVKRQLLFGIVPGILLFYACLHIPYRMFSRFSAVYYIFSIVLLLLVFIPGIGSSLNTAAKSWLVVGGISVQPSEFAKLALIIFMAAIIVRFDTRLLHLKQGFLPVLGLSIIPIALIILQPDIGTVSILLGILFSMLFFGHARYAHLGMLAGAGILLMIVMIAIAPYRAARLTTFLHPELDPEGIGYHINQAFVAIGSGGLFGLGLGHSRQKFEYLPEVHADSIFAIAAEELGFIIIALFVILLALIAFRGFIIAKHAPDPFARLLVAGIISWFMIQSFLNIGAIVGMLPLTGVPLPFVSHGGTALAIAMAGVGIVANVSRSSNL